MAIRAVAVVLALTASAACNRSPADRASAGAGNTLGTEPLPTTTLAPITTNPYAVPAVIDVAYVNRVLAGLDAAMGDVVRLILRTRTIPREAYDRLRSIYGTDDALQLSIDIFQADMRRNFAGYKTDPGNKISTVTQLLSVRQTCVFARVTRDYSAVGTNPRTADIQWIALKPIDRLRDPNNYNSTSWALIYDGFPPDHTQPADPCST